METRDMSVAAEAQALLLEPASDGPSADEDTLVHEAGESSDYRELFERQKRLFDLAMTASQMGTWCYTIGDNVCMYDENAQRLYGLTEARFLHDEDGVKSKFHADDLELMWERVAKALDPFGDGRYDVEYRVKQLDGSWRWLSAWGLVEFEGEGPDRKPIAIVGASRDLTERKRGEDFQRLLLNELGHRIKNTIARVQAVADQTIRAAGDLPSAREALSRRMSSMAQAHDLLTARDWSGAELSEVVRQCGEGFNLAQFEFLGPPTELTERQTLAMSMALHELVTNAAKYGALSRADGRVSVKWAVHGGKLKLEWSESGGPPVSTPAKQGFGTRLLERVVESDLCGHVTMDYHRSGFRCRIEADL
jgi:two-component sensor histidine kinase/PAS domain-containing protein